MLNQPNGEMKAFDILSEIEELRWRGGLIPHPRFNIANFKNTILGLATGIRHPNTIVDLSTSATQPSCILVVALDSIKFSYFSALAAEFNLDGLVPITSAFPSTSSTAWTSIHSGLPPCRHGVYGVTFFSKEFDSVYVLYHKLRDQNATFHPVPERHTFRLIGSSGPTLMQALSKKDWRCVFLRAEGASPLCINDAYYASGANVITVAPHAAREKPSVLTDLLVSEASRILSEQSKKKQAKLLLWVWFDFDLFIHNTLDYEINLQEIWKELAHWLEQDVSLNRDMRTAVVIISDHGEVPQKASKRLATGLQEIVGDTELCYAHRAGAGRAVYIYPRSTQHMRVRRSLEGLFGQDALVIEKDEAISLGLFGGQQLVFEDRVGDLILLGQTPAFPAHYLQAYHEHGGLSRDELVVPFGWRLP